MMRSHPGLEVPRTGFAGPVATAAVVVLCAAVGGVGALSPAGLIATPEAAVRAPPLAWLAPAAAGLSLLLDVIDARLALAALTLSFALDLRSLLRNAAAAVTRPVRQ